MKKINKFNIVNLIILVFIIIFKILTSFMSDSLVYLISIIFWTLLSVLLYFIGGFPKNKSYYKKASTRIIIIIILFYVLITYMFGLFLGFAKNLYFYNFIKLIKKVVPIALFIVSSEVARYLFFKHNPKGFNKYMFIMLVILLNIIIGINDYNYGYSDLFYIVAIIVLPTIASELISSYLSFNVGLAPTLLYKLFFNIYMYFVPFLPNFGDYLNSIFNVIIPYIIYCEVKKSLKFKEKYKSYAKKTITKVLSLITLIFSAIIVLLVSGIFKYQLIAIATGSMEPIYYRGDAVIIEKVDSKSIEIGDILVYKMGNAVITHRVISIVEDNGTIKFYTKGDNNNSADSLAVNQSNVIGKVKYIVKYIGYPTIMLSELF